MSRSVRPAEPETLARAVVKEIEWLRRRGR